MKDADITLAEHIATVEAITATATEIAKILDTKYQKVDLHSGVVEACSALNIREKEKLVDVLKKHEELFDSILGMWRNFQYDIKLQEGVKPYHRRLYMVPKAYKAMF
eukprot:498774-Ditylum_brightwellii.AAC.1